MAYTQQNLDDINAAIATGVMEVTINGRTTKFRSLDEMLRTKSIIERSLSTTAGSGDRVIRTTYSRDYQ
ncbi:MAG: phage head-tail joining protein [Cellvibrionaceae bacterium]